MFSFLEDTFSVIEWLTITGFVQCAVILVYIAFRVRDWRQASLALAYFTVLALSFALRFSMRIEEYEPLLRVAVWFSRALGPSLCYLLVLQIARGGAPPSARQFWTLALPPAALVIAYVIRNMADICDQGASFCPGFLLWLSWLGSISGGLIMLSLWMHKDIFSVLRKAKGGMERYWLVLVLILANMGAVAISFMRASGELSWADADSLLIVLSLTFIYLATTALFRIYPSAVQLSPAPTRFTAQALTAEEQDIATRVRKLMEVDKLYHEHTFSRADLARELDVSENTLSRVINVALGKSFPQMLNEFRVDDARRMLQNVEIPIQVVASEVGFNSLASFNRVFREITALTPSQYRHANAVPIIQPKD